MLVTVWDCLTNFSVALFVVELLMAMRARRRSLFWVRMLVWTPFVTIPVGYWLATGSYFYMLPWFRIGWYPWIFTALMAVSALLLWCCFEMSATRALFIAVASHGVQNVMYMEDLLIELAMPEDGLMVVALELMACLVTLAIVWKVCAQRLHRNEVDVSNVAMLTFVVVSSLIVGVLNYWAYSFSYVSTATLVYQLTCSALLLVVQFNVFNRSVDMARNAAMEQMLRAAERRYRLTQENIDIINRKCHDLKHQITLLRDVSTPVERENSLAQIEQAIDIYDSLISSGNRALDTLIMEKSLICAERGIELTTLVDGSKLGFLEDVDVYSLLGNALDNAIEREGLEAEENRIISLTSRESGDNMLAIQIDNYCSQPVAFVDGLPKTTKADSAYHGIGTRSMRYVAERYGGTLSMQWSAEHNRFSVTILFPATSHR